MRTATKTLAPFNGDETMLGLAQAWSKQCISVSYMFLQAHTGSSVLWQQNAGNKLSGDNLFELSQNENANVLHYVVKPQ